MGACKGSSGKSRGACLVMCVIALNVCVLCVCREEGHKKYEEVTGSVLFVA